MVLSRKYQAFETGPAGRGRPLSAIKVSRGENILPLGSRSPFGPRKSVGPEMAEHIHLHLLPFKLFRSRNAPVRRRHLRGAGGKAYGKGRHEQFIYKFHSRHHIPSSIPIVSLRRRSEEEAPTRMRKSPASTTSFMEGS